MDGALCKLRMLWDTFMFWLLTMFSTQSPAEFIYHWFGNRRGRVKMVSRDLICDLNGLKAVPQTDRSTDETSTVNLPFMVLLRLNDEPWKRRKRVATVMFRREFFKRLEPLPELRFREGPQDLWKSMTSNLSEVSFRYIFGRDFTENERETIFKGMTNQMKFLKRQLFDWKGKEQMYDAIVNAIRTADERFLFANDENFANLTEYEQASTVAADFVVGFAVQISDYLCHLLLLWAEQPQHFMANLANSMKETLRLYPVNEMYIRMPYNGQKGWQASLIQLNRTGHPKPDEFWPERFEDPACPPPETWGLGVRRCPAEKLVMMYCEKAFLKIINTDGFWMVPAKDFRHDRRLALGVQVWVGYGKKEENIRYEFGNTWPKKFWRWIMERKRIWDQAEIR